MKNWFHVVFVGLFNLELIGSLNQTLLKLLLEK